MSRPLAAREEEFLSRLESLYREFGVYVGSCGCCSSPWVAKHDEGNSFGSIEASMQNLRQELAESNAPESPLALPLPDGPPKVPPPPS